MANVEKTTVEVLKPVAPDAVVLTLSWEEAEVLSHILNRIGGSPDDTRRGIVESIGDALVTVVGDTYQNFNDIDPVKRAIYFTKLGEGAY